MNRPDQGAWPTFGQRRGRSRSAGSRRRALRREAYPRGDPGDVDTTHALDAEGDEPFARGGRVGDQLLDVYAVAARGERRQTLDPFLEQGGGAVKIPVAPVMETDADLQDPVIEAPHRRSRVAPKQLEGLVLLEELAGVELLDAADQLRRRRVIAAGARGLIDLAAGDALGRPRRLAVAATRTGRVRCRRSCGSAARLRGTRVRAGSRMPSGALPVGPRMRP